MMGVMRRVIERYQSYLFYSAYFGDLGSPTGNRCIDVCCGSGYFSKVAMQNNEGLSFQNVDIVPRSSFLGVGQYFSFDVTAHESIDQHLRGADNLFLNNSWQLFTQHEWLIKLINITGVNSIYVVMPTDECLFELDAKGYKENDLSSSKESLLAFMLAQNFEAVSERRFSPGHIKLRRLRYFIDLAYYLINGKVHPVESGDGYYMAYQFRKLS